MNARHTHLSIAGACAALFLSGASLAPAVAYAEADASAGSLRLALVRADDAVEVHATGAGWSSRITGFGFGAEKVWLGQNDLDHDGDLDIVVTNASALPAGSGESPGSEREAAAYDGLPNPAVYSIIVPSEGLPPTVDVSEAAPGITAFESDLRGDRDNFGFGPFVVAPCRVFDNSEPQDLLAFDYVTSGSDVNRWFHTFSPTGIPDSLVLRTAEIFSDHIASTIDLDRHTLDFATPPFSECNYGPFGLARNFVLSGSDAQIAADGLVTVTFRDNGDLIAMEFSVMTIHVP